MMKPPTNAPRPDPRAVEAAARVDAQHRGQPVARNELRARAESYDARHNPPANSNGEKPDEGKVLAKVSRPDGTELRVSLHSFEGKPYVRVGPWQRGRDGATMWPVKGKVTTVRTRELGAVVRALIDAMDDVDNDNARRGSAG